MRKFLARRISSLLVAAILFSTVFDNMWAAHIVYANVEENTDKEDIKQADTSMELLDDEAFTDLLTIDEEDPTGSNLSSDTLIEAESGNDTIFNEDLPVTDDALEGDDTLCEVANDKAPADASWLRFYNTTSDNTARKITVKSMKNDITSDFQITIPAKTDIGGVTYTTVLDNSGNGQKSLWYSQREVIRSIKIEKGVEAAGNCSYLFYGLKKLTSLDVSGLDTSKVTDMSYMFSEDDALTGLDLSGFDTSKVTSMAGMFRSCDALKTVNLSNFNTSSVTDMNNMFYYDLALESLDLSGFDTSKVINMRYMMGDCRSLKEVDLS
jgi:surface protein